jgi:hypothetical protein
LRAGNWCPQDHGLGDIVGYALQMSGPAIEILPVDSGRTNAKDMFSARTMAPFHIFGRDRMAERL